MNVIIRETSEVRDLNIIDLKTGQNWTMDFIGNSGALNDGQFTEDIESLNDEVTYMCDQETFNWWVDAIDRNEKNDLVIEAIREYCNDYSLDNTDTLNMLDAICPNGEYADTMSIEYIQIIFSNNFDLVLEETNYGFFLRKKEKEMIIAEDSCNGEEEAFKDWMEANYPEIITTIENTLHGGYFENGELKESKFWDDFCIA